MSRRRAVGGTGPASNAFVPWFRRGAATLIPPQIASPHSFVTVERVSFPAALRFNKGTADAVEATRDVALLGPGEIVGFDARAVTRTWPPRNVFEADNRALAQIEFDQPDLPWRYTADAAPVRTPERLRPWIVLIVLAPDEIDAYRAPDSQQPLASVRVKSATVLPNLAESWAWAHVQVTGRSSITPAEALQLFESAPHTMVSRILCPRRLEPRIRYRAFLVPAFERGRRAGLGAENVDVTTDSTFTQGIPVDARRPSWGGPPPVGLSATPRPLEFPVYYEWEFETAATACDFKALALRLTARPLPDGIGTLDVDASSADAALPAIEIPFLGALMRPAAPQPVPAPAFTGAMETLVAGRTVLPIYGRWLAGRATPNVPWMGTNNVDPRFRAAAGLGARVVEKNEEALLAGSWQQIEGLPEINEKLRTAQLAREIGARVFQRRFRTASLDAFLMLAAPLFKRVATEGVSIASRVAGSRIGRGPFEPVFRRLLRRVGEGPIVERMNRGQVVPAPRPPAPALAAMPPQVNALAFWEAPQRSAFAVMPEVGPGHPPPGNPPAGGVGPDSAAAKNLRWAALRMLSRLRVLFNEPPPGEPLQLDAIRTSITQQSDPATSLAARMTRALRIAPGFPRAAADALEPVLAAPSFDHPMYEPLAKLSQEWILPGIGTFPANTVSLAQSNQRFIEAYMTGLAHELNRSLLWRGYPTDQRATYFRSFWDSLSYFGPRTDGELLDIAPLETWPAASVAGSHSSRPPLANGADPLVLLIRGDLLQHYPGAVVYATRATLGKGRRPEPLAPPQERHPIFQGRVDPDVAFFGFELTADEAKGKPDGTDAGWFFVLQEQPSEPRFGLGTAAATPPPALSSALVAHTSILPPARVAIHASRMI